ncbi:MAG TPA: hypothetical protein VFS20_06035 [Longimicrobium sp.]|nr:hypothetical protein [Longimicrobium sp.]
MVRNEAHSPGVLIRDMLIFSVKLLVDGLKDIVLLKLGILAFCLDLFIMLLTRSRGRFFYKVLELGERFDLWLNLYRPAAGAGRNPEGLFGESRAGDPTFLGGVEELVRGRPEPIRRPVPGGAGSGYRR